MYLGLARAGIKLELICHPDAPDKHIFTDNGIRVTEIPIRHRLDMNAILNLRNKLKDNGYDIIYTSLNSCLSTSLLASLGMKIKHVSYRGTMGHLSRLDPASWLTYLNPRIDRIVCVSEAVRKYLLSLQLPESRLVTIYKGHDINWYSNLKKPSLGEFGIPANAFTVGFTGRIRPVKGVKILIKAASRLKNNHDFHFILAGAINDPGITEIAEDPSTRTRIHFLGERKDAAAIAGTCDVFVMPSIAREGLPRSVIESMSQGVPPIVSNVGGMPELVTNNETGLVVPPLDPEALANAISFMADNPAKRKEMGQHAKNRIETFFNIKTTVDKMLQLFQGLAGT